MGKERAEEAKEVERVRALLGVLDDTVIEVRLRSGYDERGLGFFDVHLKRQPKAPAVPVQAGFGQGHEDLAGLGQFMPALPRSE